MRTLFIIIHRNGWDMHTDYDDVLNHVDRLYGIANGEGDTEVASIYAVSTQELEELLEEEIKEHKGMIDLSDFFYDIPFYKDPVEVYKIQVDEEGFSALGLERLGDE